jgi:hypothetical protein
MNVIRFRPLTAWPYPETEPRRSRYIFKAGWENTLTLLERELNHLDADNVIIGAFLRETDIRQDGFPRASARTPDHPGVEVSFDSPHGRLVYATDVCETYQHNVRSIALGLASLRAVDRYGITRRGEQYAGWKELPAGIAVPAATMTPKAAAEFLAFHAGFEEGNEHRLLSELQLVGYAFHEAAKRLHPDKGGSADEFTQLQGAKAALEAHIRGPGR